MGSRRQPQFSELKRIIEQVIKSPKTQLNYKNQNLPHSFISGNLRSLIANRNFERFIVQILWTWKLFLLQLIISTFFQVTSMFPQKKSSLSFKFMINEIRGVQIVKECWYFLFNSSSLWYKHNSMYRFSGRFFMTFQIIFLCFVLFTFLCESLKCKFKLKWWWITSYLQIIFLLLH